MKEAKQILSEIKKGEFRPVYFLMGDESFFIDKIESAIEKKALLEDEKVFNQEILYGRETDIKTIVSSVKKYPMMSQRRLVIVREAQNLSTKIEDLISYVENPLKSSILVICYKGKTLDKRKKLYKTINKNGGFLLDSKRLYDNQVVLWMDAFLKENGYSISQKAKYILLEFLGNDLTKISKELQKLIITLPNKTNITPDIIEENIGFSKQYNNFELQKAIGNKDILKANEIIKYFASNPNKNPFIVTISIIYNYLTNIVKYHIAEDKSQMGIAKSLKINPYFVKDYYDATKNYSLKKTIKTISYLREADAKLKGVNSQDSHYDIMRELIFKIMH